MSVCVYICMFVCVCVCMYENLAVCMLVYWYRCVGMGMGVCSLWCVSVCVCVCVLVFSGYLRCLPRNNKANGFYLNVL